MIKAPTHDDGEIVVQLATRVPKTLARELKLYAITVSRPITELVTTYIRDGIARDQRAMERKATKRGKTE